MSRSPSWFPVSRSGGNALAAAGIAAVDSAAIQAAHDALPPAGGIIRLAAGIFELGSTTISITKPTVFQGVGPSGGGSSIPAGYTDTAITIIRYSSTTGVAITVAADACMFENFHLVNTAGSAPTAGAGILCTDGGAGFRFNKISVAGFYRNIAMTNGFEWFMNQCTLYDFIKSAIQISNPSLPDAGDMSITACQIYAGPTYNGSYGIEWNSAGGLKLLNTKFNARGGKSLTIGLLFATADAISTSVFNIVANSFENMGYGIHADDSQVATGTGHISKLSVIGNEFLCSNAAFMFQRTNVAYKTSQVNIASNIFSGGLSVGAIVLKTMDNVKINGNTYDSTVTLAKKIIVQSNVTNLFTDIDVVSAQTTGTAVLNGAANITITTAAVTATSIIMLTQQIPGGIQSGIAFVVSRVALTSFTISSIAGDTSTVGWQIIEPH